MPEFEPIRFGKYLIFDKIATGGMAELYKAKITSVIKKYRNIGYACRGLNATKAVWGKRILDNLMIKTPNQKLDLLINSWLKNENTIFVCRKNTIFVILRCTIGRYVENLFN